MYLIKQRLKFYRSCLSYQGHIVLDNRWSSDWHRIHLSLPKLCKLLWIFTNISPCSSDSKESACNVGDLGLIPGSGRSPGEGNDNPFECSCLENPMDRGAWWATVHGILQARILEWVVIPFSRGSSWLRDQNKVSLIASGFFTIWANREALASC